MILNFIAGTLPVQICLSRFSGTKISKIILDFKTLQVEYFLTINIT